MQVFFIFTEQILASYENIQADIWHPADTETVKDRDNCFIRAQGSGCGGPSQTTNTDKTDTSEWKAGEYMDEYFNSQI